jgi:MoxR-like ATPase
VSTTLTVLVGQGGASVAAMSDERTSATSLPTLAESAEVTREAIAALLAGPWPTAITIDGATLGVESTKSPERAHAKLVWPRGSMRLRISRVTSNLARRSEPADRDHCQGIQVLSEDGGREMAWISIEWVVRDAIREGTSAVNISAWTSFMERGAAEEETGIGNAELGRRARELCAKSGLNEGAWVPLGTYDLQARSWTPEPTEVLRRLLVVGAVKTVLRDRGRGLLMQGEVPFAIRVPSTAISKEIALPPSERLAAVHLWFGPGARQVEGVREALQFIAEETPTTKTLGDWLRAQAQLPDSDMSIYTRPLLQLGLAQRDEQDRWTVTAVGAELLESESADVLYRSFVARFVGFEETLAFYGRSESGDTDALLADLNRRLGTAWTASAQPTRRAYWLRAMGLLEGERGQWQLSAKGRAVFEALPASLKESANPKPDEVDEEEVTDLVTPLPARLVAEDVSLRDLQIEPTLIAKCIAALNARKHILLIGPPGTGKSEIGSALARHAADVYGLNKPLLATASADWTAYDTIGGWTQRADQRLAFRPGVLTRAIGERRWLVLDELNRADVDKCLGEAFTVLAGGEAETAYTDDDGAPVRIGRGSHYDPGEWFRVIATMNVRDKATLFRLSYALLRRFAIIEVPAPDDPTLRAIARADAQRLGIDAQFADLTATVFMRADGLGRIVELGAAMMRDILSYAKQRSPSALAIAEGVELFVLPQLDGLEASEAKEARNKLAAIFGADTAARDALLLRFDAYFPHVRFDA